MSKRYNKGLLLLSSMLAISVANANVDTNRFAIRHLGSLVSEGPGIVGYYVPGQNGPVNEEDVITTEEKENTEERNFRVNFLVPKTIGESTTPELMEFYTIDKSGKETLRKAPIDNKSSKVKGTKICNVLESTDGAAYRCFAIDYPNGSSESNAIYDKFIIKIYDDAGRKKERVSIMGEKPKLFSKLKDTDSDGVYDTLELKNLSSDILKVIIAEDGQYIGLAKETKDVNIPSNGSYDVAIKMKSVNYPKDVNRITDSIKFTYRVGSGGILHGTVNIVLDDTVARIKEARDKAVEEAKKVAEHDRDVAIAKINDNTRKELNKAVGEAEKKAKEDKKKAVKDAEANAEKDKQEALAMAEKKAKDVMEKALKAANTAAEDNKKKEIAAANKKAKDVMEEALKAANTAAEDNKKKEIETANKKAELEKQRAIDVAVQEAIAKQTKCITDVNTEVGRRLEEKLSDISKKFNAALGDFLLKIDKGGTWPTVCDDKKIKGDADLVKICKLYGLGLKRGKLRLDSLDITSNYQP